MKTVNSSLSKQNKAIYMALLPDKFYTVSRPHNCRKASRRISLKIVCFGLFSEGRWGTRKQPFSAPAAT
jgi:hypothetical protein